MTKTNYLKADPLSKKYLPWKVVKWNYVKYLDLINYGKQTTVFTKTLVHAVNTTFYGYWNVTIKLRLPETLSLN